MKVKMMKTRSWRQKLEEKLEEEKAEVGGVDRRQMTEKFKIKSKLKKIPRPQIKIVHNVTFQCGRPLSTRNGGMPQVLQSSRRIGGAKHCESFTQK